jgi:hypothetical protein
VFNVTEVVRLIKVNPRGARFVNWENGPSVVVPIILIRLRTSEGINGFIQRVREHYLGFPKFLQPQNRNQNLIRPTVPQVFVYLFPSQRKSFLSV